MLKMFKRSYALYLILAIPGAIAIYAAMWQKYPESILMLLSIPLIIIWIYAVATIAEIYAIKLDGKIKALLTEECNPKDYIAFYEKALKTKNVNKIKNYILLNLNTGYHSSGDAEESKRILDMVNGFPSTKSGAVNSVCYFNNLAGYYLRINDLENAENTLGNMKEALENPKLNKMNYEIFYQLYSSKNVILNMARGNYGGAEDHFNILFDKEKSLLGKVSAKYYLGELYIRLGNNEKAMSAFEYVLQNGNETYYAQKASEYLGKPLEVAQPSIKPSSPKVEYCSCRHCGKGIDKNSVSCPYCDTLVNEKKSNSKIIKTILFCLFIISFFTIHFALWLVSQKTGKNKGLAAGMANMTKNMWLFFVPLPIPLSSLVLGIIYKRKGFKATKNIVVGIVFSILLLLYGSFYFIFSNINIFSHDFSYVNKIETQINFDLPNEGNITTQNWTGGTQTGAQAETVQYLYMSDIAFIDKEEISKLNKEISQSDLWLTYMNTSLLGVVPMMYSNWSTQNDYFMIYNADLKTYNALPKSSGTYKFVFIAYNSQKGTMEIGEYYLKVLI